MLSSWNASYVACAYVHYLLAAIMSRYSNPTIMDDACQPGSLKLAPGGPSLYGPDWGKFWELAHQLVIA